MAIAKLSIDLEARLAGLQAGLDKAGLLAEKQAAAISGAFGKANAAATALGATLAGALGAAGITALFRATVDGLDKLNDLSDATGASVENLSALEDIALRTGASIDVAGDAIVKMNKALADAKPGSDAAAAFEALNLSVEELKRLDPVEAFQKLAVSLGNFANDGNKARIVQELFGKSLKDVAPLLKDVAEAGRLQAKVTSEQAQAAETFNKQIFELQKNAVDLARTISGPLVAALNELYGALKGDGAGALNQYLAVPLQAVTVLGANVAFVMRGIGTEIGGIAAQAAAVARLDFKGAATIGELMREDAKAAREEFDKLERRLMSMGGAAQASYSNEGRNAAARLPSLPGSLGSGKAGKDGKSKPFDVGSFALQEAGDLREAFEAIDKINREWVPAQWFGGEASLSEAELLRKAFEEIEVVNRNAEKAVKDLKEPVNEVGQELGLVFSSAAGEAIAKFENLRQVLKGVLADIAQIAIKKTITDPLGKFIGDSLKGFSLANLFAANGQAFGAGGQVQPFARGGVVDSPTLFKFAKGTGLMGEAGPEAILPLQRGRGGKLGVAVQGGMGRALTYAPVIHIDSRSDQAQVAQLVGQMLAADKQALFEYMRAQGAM
jgi:hypothetical protein